MKRLLSLILAALLTASAFTACTDATVEETDAVETAVPETTVPEVTVNPNLVTENGAAKAHIVVAEGGDVLLTYAAEELAYHVKKVSGAELPVVTTAATDSLAVVIATPDTCSDLATLFPEDIAWLSTLEDGEKRYGSDGFAIRRHENTLYIFGITERGTLNGVYDFIEENMGVLWIRGDEETGMIYDEQPTVTIMKADYREKSPFEVRGWNLGGREGEDLLASDRMMSRNKTNALLIYPPDSIEDLKGIGLTSFHLQHNAKTWVLQSPIYDPAVTEYWNNTEDGTPIPLDEWSQINFWSERTADTVAQSMIAYLHQTGLDSVGFGVDDNYVCTQYPECTMPFEYAPDQFAQPDDPAYLSTVYFTFLNRVAEKVNAVFPEVEINTFAYALVEQPPLCEVDDSIRVVIAPILEDMTSPVTDTSNSYNAPVFALIEAWKQKTDNIVVYNYYVSCCSRGQYERPIWDRIQADHRYYAENGFVGLMPEGMTDTNLTDALKKAYTYRDGWDLNTLTYWLHAKLAWDPEEDVDALIAYFCDRVYGAASEQMREYYRLIEQGWNDATEKPNYLWNYKLSAESYFDVFVYQVDLDADIVATLRSAYEAAETEVIKERIRPILESYEAAFPEV